MSFSFETMFIYQLKKDDLKRNKESLVSTLTISFDEFERFFFDKFLMIKEIWASATDNASWFIGLRSAKADEDEVDVGMFEIIITNKQTKKKKARLNLEERKSQNRK